MKKTKKTDILLSSGRDNPFRVPENYFDELPERILSRVHQKENTGAVHRPWHAIRPRLALAAAVAGFLIMIWAGIRIFSGDQREGIPLAVIEDFIEFYVSDFEENALFETAEHYRPANSTSSGLQEDFIIEYLVYEKIDDAMLYPENE